MSPSQVGISTVDLWPVFQKFLRNISGGFYAFNLTGQERARETRGMTYSKGPQAGTELMAAAENLYPQYMWHTLCQLNYQGVPVFQYFHLYQKYLARIKSQNWAFQKQKVILILQNCDTDLVIRIIMIPPGHVRLMASN